MAKGTQPKDFFWYVLIVIISFPLIPLFDHIGKSEFERPAAMALGLILLVVKICRDVRGRLWFWITIMGIGAFHAPLLMLTAQRLTTMPLAGMFVLGVVDVTVMFSVIRLIERLIDGRNRPIAASHTTRSHF